MRQHGRKNNLFTKNESNASIFLLVNQEKIEKQAKEYEGKYPNSCKGI